MEKEYERLTFASDIEDAISKGEIPSKIRHIIPNPNDLEDSEIFNEENYDNEDEESKNI